MWTEDHGEALLDQACPVAVVVWQDISFSRALGMIIETADKARADVASTRRVTPASNGIPG
jgi:hypothetical protein